MNFFLLNWVPHRDAKLDLSLEQNGRRKLVVLEFLGVHPQQLRSFEIRLKKQQIQ